MRAIDEATDAALEGTRPADSLTVWAWRDGSLVVPEPLDVISWSFNDEAGENVKVGQKVSLTVADPDGTLGAWRFDDPLGVAGTKLQIIYRVGGAGAVNFGWFRIVGNDPSVMVDSRLVNEYGLVVPDSEDEAHTRRIYIDKGIVRLEAVDLTIDVDRDRFESPESPGADATALSEFARLTQEHFPTVVDDGVDDVDVSRQLVFDRERLDACQDLLSRVGARYRMGGDGECHVYPLVTDPVWRVAPNAGLINVARKQSLDGLYNRWVVEGQDQTEGDPIRGVVSIETGPLRWGGPHGRAPYFYRSEMIRTQSQAIGYAVVLRRAFLASLAIELDVETVPRPELQGGDRIEVGCPFDGRIVYVTGTITGVRRAGAPVPNRTQFTVSCSYADVSSALSRTDRKSVV